MARSGLYLGSGAALWLREELEIAREKTERIERTNQALQVARELDPQFVTWYETHVLGWMTDVQKMAMAEERANELLKQARLGLTEAEATLFCELVEQGNSHALVLAQARVS